MVIINFFVLSFLPAFTYCIIIFGFSRIFFEKLKLTNTEGLLDSYLDLDHQIQRYSEDEDSIHQNYGDSLL